MKLFAIALLVLFFVPFLGCGSDLRNEITVISREDGSGTRGAFTELFGIIEKTATTRKDLTTKEAIITNKTDVTLNNIKSDVNAIGYISLGSLNDGVKALSIDCVAPTAENIKNGSYTAARPFSIAVPDETDALTEDFIAFILSREGQQVVSEGYISITDNAPSYSGAAPGGKITVAGSSSVTPVMEKLKEAYLVHNPSAVIEIQMSDSTSGMTGATEGTCNIGMSSRALKESELAHLTEISIALDGIVIVVNKENTVSELTTPQVRAIFTGEITAWDEIR